MHPPQTHPAPVCIMAKKRDLTKQSTGPSFCECHMWESHIDATSSGVMMIIGTYPGINVYHSRILDELTRGLKGVGPVQTQKLAPFTPPGGGLPILFFRVVMTRG